MQRLVYLLSILFLVLIALPVSANPPKDSREQIMGEARQGFEEILDIWRDELFEELYDRTIPSDKYSREYFLERLVNSTRRPACCWEKLQDVKTVYVSPERVTLIARVGMEIEGVGTEYVTQSFDLSREDGVWKVPMADILSLADTYTYRAFPRKILEKPLP